MEKQRRRLRVLLLPEPLVEAAREAGQQRGVSRNRIVQEAAAGLVERLRQPKERREATNG